MNIRDTLKKARRIAMASPNVAVEQTVVNGLMVLFPQLERRELGELDGLSEPAIRVGVMSSLSLSARFKVPPAAERNWMFLRVDADGNVDILSSVSHLLYLAFTMVTEELNDRDVNEYRDGRLIYPAFASQRPLYDLFATQHARSVRNFDRVDYFRSLARSGFSHAEVNGLAFPVALEKGPKDEVYSRFYTYCPSLDQFVSSALNTGTYDEEYLQANLNYLKTNAELAEKYGLTPGIVCFEPRSVPESLLRRYPMLRGARVDHPMRSFEPRYNLSVAHPIVREHYAEMLDKLMKEVPSLGYMSIWSNDSGAGFEYTNSLYVGRNGGGYLVREWLGSGEIEAAAATNLVRFMKLLRDSARKTNPEFRVLLRMEPFWLEHDHILDQLEEGLDLEVSSLKGKGWELSYRHPTFGEDVQIHTTALHNRFESEEKVHLEELAEKGVSADVVFAPGIIWNHEPLIGIPFPHLVYEKLRDMKMAGVKNVCVLGGNTPERFAPFNINQELVRAFEADREFEVEPFLERKSVEWAGPSASIARKLWKLTDDAVRAFPIPIWIYAAWGVWYRLAVRPVVPNIEAIPEQDRAYYEKFLLATPHNRCRVDFRYDVGFDLLAPDRAWRAVDFIDKNCLPPLELAVGLAYDERLESRDERSLRFTTDQWERLRGLRCWMRTQRNVTGWVAGVHTYLQSTDGEKKLQAKRLVRSVVLDEISNTVDLLVLWDKSTSNWMMVSDVGETTFIYYKNFGELLRRKINLMTGHEDDEPHVDPEFQWRLSSFHF